MASESVLRSTTRAPLLCRLLIATAFLASLLAYWSIPCKLAFGPNGSWYTCAYAADELYYMERVQPLIADTAATNTINGIRDTSVISPFYLEDLCRWFLSVTGINVITFVWAWRILLPIIMALLLVLIARECIPRTHGRMLQFAIAAFALGLIPCCYDLVTDFPQPQVFINRVFTNVEYPLSLLLAWLCIRFQRRPSLGRGVALAIASVATVYLRTYVSLVWFLTCAGTACLHLLQRRMQWKTAFAMLGILGLGIIPWIAVNAVNNHSSVYAEVTRRFFGTMSYQVHPRIVLYSIIAVILLCAAYYIPRRLRPFSILCGLSMVAFSFCSGLFWFRQEILIYDRFGMFYWIAISCAIMMIAGGRLAASAFSTPGHNRLIAVVACVNLALSAGMIWFNSSYQYSNQFGPGDSAYVPAYQWIDANTPADSLFLADDGYDWSLNVAPAGAHGELTLGDGAPDGTPIAGKGDLFQIIARRRRLYSEHLLGTVISDNQMFQLMLLHRSALGFPVSREMFKELLKVYRPTHILWRKVPIYPGQKPAPVPRGYGAQLREFCTIIYTDKVCEVWKINYP